MTYSFGSAGDAQLATKVYGAVWLVDTHFLPSPLYWTTAPTDLDANGHTYRGLGQLLGVSMLAESEDASTEKLTIAVPAANQAALAATIGNLDAYRGRRVRLWLQLVNEAFVRVGTPVARWSGYMEPVKVTRSRPGPEAGPFTGRIELPCSRAGMARARNYEGLRLTHAQQQRRYPGDRGLEYVQTLVEQPSLWLSKKFQEI